MFGSTWEYVSWVMAMVECPSISETIFGFTLRVSSSVAHVCRRSWKRISGSPARFRSGLNFCFVTARLSSGSPVSDANIRPSASPGLHRELRGSAGPGETVGLSSMRDRVGLLSGNLQIRSEPGLGTSVVAEIPLPAAGEEKEDINDEG